MRNLILALSFIIFSIQFVYSQIDTNVQYIIDPKFEKIKLDSSYFKLTNGVKVLKCLNGAPSINKLDDKCLKLDIVGINNNSLANGIILFYLNLKNNERSEKEYISNILFNLNFDIKFSEKYLNKKITINCYLADSKLNRFKTDSQNDFEKVKNKMFRQIIFHDTVSSTNVIHVKAVVDRNYDKSPYMSTISNGPATYMFLEIICKASKMDSMYVLIDNFSFSPDYKIKSKTVSIKAIVLNNVLFETSKSILLPSSNNELNKLVEQLKKNPKMQIELRGHTDNVGDEAKNQALSEGRAKAVYDYLVAKGIDKNRLSYKGFGSKKPIAVNTTEEGRKNNRRVEMVIIKE